MTGKQEATASSESPKGALDIEAILKPLAIVVATVAVSLIVSYVLAFGPRLSTSQEKWGQFGDYFGGVMNPLIGCFSLVLLLFALHLQNELLRETRKQLKISREELELSRDELAKSAIALDAQVRLLNAQNQNEWLLRLVGLRNERQLSLGDEWAPFIEKLAKATIESIGKANLKSNEFHDAIVASVTFQLGFHGKAKLRRFYEVLQIDLETLNYIKSLDLPNNNGQENRWGLLVSQIDSHEAWALLSAAALRETFRNDAESIATLIAECERRDPVLSDLSDSQVVQSRKNINVFLQKVVFTTPMFS